MVAGSWKTIKYIKFTKVVWIRLWISIIFSYLIHISSRKFSLLGWVRLLEQPPKSWNITFLEDSFTLKWSCLLAQPPSPAICDRNQLLQKYPLANWDWRSVIYSRKPMSIEEKLLVTSHSKKYWLVKTGILSHRIHGTLWSQLPWLISKRNFIHAEVEYIAIIKWATFKTPLWHSIILMIGS